MSVDKIAAAILYEGYLLWPYRRSAPKNQQRWTFGGVYPRAFSETTFSNDPWLMQTECLVLGQTPHVSIEVRFLQVVERHVGEPHSSGMLAFADEIGVDGQRYLTWEEAIERTIHIPDLPLPRLERPQPFPFYIAAGQSHEPLVAADGSVAGGVVRCWRELEGCITVQAAQIQPGFIQPDAYRLRVTITNETAWVGHNRAETLHQTCVSTHTILTTREGMFISMTEPPDMLRPHLETCQNIKTWPVLVGEPGATDTMLSSPIILYDYPQIAPESPGDLFDGTEIDQLLMLNILTLTEAEKEEMRATDGRAREILARADALTADDFMQLHGAIREFRRLDRAPIQVTEEHV